MVSKAYRWFKVLIWEIWAVDALTFAQKYICNCSDGTVGQMGSKQTRSTFTIRLFVWEIIFVKVVLKTKYLCMSKLICGYAGWMLESWGSSAVVLRGWGVQKSIFSLCQQTNTARVQFDVFWSLSLCGKWPQHQTCPWHLVWAPPPSSSFFRPHLQACISDVLWPRSRGWWSGLDGLFYHSANKIRKKKEAASRSVCPRQALLELF